MCTALSHVKPHYYICEQFSIIVSVLIFLYFLHVLPWPAMTGVFKNPPPADVYIDLKHISELYINKVHGEITFVVDIINYLIIFNYFSGDYCNTFYTHIC